MHYIRLLRPPALVAADGAKPDSLPVLSLVLTITTDLGDAFLSPDEPLGLVIELEVEVEEEEDEEEDEDDDDGDEDEEDDDKKTAGDKTVAPPAPTKLLFRLPTTAVTTDKKKSKPAAAAAPPPPPPPPPTSEPAWTAGMRVLKLEAALPRDAAAVWRSDDVKRFCVRAARDDVCATEAGQIINPKGGSNGLGLVLPLWIDVPDDAIHSDEPFPHVALRRLGVGRNGSDGSGGSGGSGGSSAIVEVEEDIGESIARHVWDAGLVTVAFLADTFGLLKENPKKRPHDDAADHDSPDQQTLASLLRATLQPQPHPPHSLRILELGTGVGILGIGLATILHAAAASYHGDATVLLTDLPEAEERAVSNINLLEPALSADGIHVAYANLDWEDGRRGTFDAAVVGFPPGQAFDLIMLSDCTYNVDMLPALVETLDALQQATHQATQRVLLTKKTRHASEALLFTLMADHGWRMRAGGGQAVRLPVLDGEEQTIEVFLYERSV